MPNPRDRDRQQRELTAELRHAADLRAESRRREEAEQRATQTEDQRTQGTAMLTAQETEQLVHDIQQAFPMFEVSVPNSQRCTARSLKVNTLSRACRMCRSRFCHRRACAAVRRCCASSTPIHSITRRAQAMPSNSTV